MTEELRLSRVTMSVAALGADALDAHRFAQKAVLLTGEPTVLATTNGEDMLLFALRLLVRISTQVEVVLPSGCAELAEGARALTDDIGLGGHVTLAEGPIAFDRYAAILSVGTRARPDLPWTVINSNGWLARVSSGAVTLNDACDQRNPIGARVAACLGVSEVFKRLASVRAQRGLLADGLLFSAYTYTCAADDPGPALPAVIVLPTFLLAGCGAIGNGIVELLGALGCKGSGVLIDKQRFGVENLDTCALMRVGDVGRSKAETLAEILRTHGVDVVGIEGTIAELAPRLGDDLVFPAVVLGGLDEIPPRHELQRLWPDVYLDGAISPFGCQVSRFPRGQDVGCALCVLEVPLVSTDAIALRITGLPIERLHDPDAVIEPRDVEVAKTNEQKAWLRERLGRPICSVVPESMLATISRDVQPTGFAPSVPFVACLSAALVVGEFVKLATGAPSALAPRFQMDVLQGPQRGELFDEARSSRCECVTRAQNIERARAKRAGA